ncbi:MAG: hypothetical protein IJF97_00825 [Eggerthellaceae bacterium]|nr:hypothetical protein [Eggerthellaceae bacterium]MBQ3342721.1 hypothetical protein [Kiritimatiellia bacterium]
MPENTQQAQPNEDQPRTFTQEQVDNIVRERLARAKAEPPADYEELKAKAAKYDEAQEAAKSDLQRATEEKDKWKDRYEELKAGNDRRDAIAAAASEYGVDAAMLERMSGDVVDNAKFLKSQAETTRKFPTVSDGGQQTDRGAVTTAQMFAEAFDGL